MPVRFLYGHTSAVAPTCATELYGRRSIDTDQLPLPGSMKLAEFLQDVRHGKPGNGCHLTRRKRHCRSTFPGWLAAEPGGTRQNPHTGSALAVLVPDSDLASQAS